MVESLKYKDSSVILLHILIAMYKMICFLMAFLEYKFMMYVKYELTKTSYNACCTKRFWYYGIGSTFTSIVPSVKSCFFYILTFFEKKILSLNSFDRWRCYWTQLCRLVSLMIKVQSIIIFSWMHDTLNLWESPNSVPITFLPVFITHRYANQLVKPQMWCQSTKSLWKKLWHIKPKCSTLNYGGKYTTLDNMIFAKKQLNNPINEPTCLDFFMQDQNHWTRLHILFSGYNQSICIY